MDEILKFLFTVFVGLLLIGGLALGGYFVVKQIKVWGMEQDGRALLAQAEQTKKIMIETAKAEKESAQLKADAIKILGETAQKYPEYRNQEFINAFGEALKEGKIQQIIYVPTEANIPILEATRK